MPPWVIRRQMGDPTERLPLNEELGSHGKTSIMAYHCMHEHSHKNGTGRRHGMLGQPDMVLPEVCGWGRPVMGRVGF